MTGYCLFCTLCKAEYFTKFEWLKHLTTEDHQTLARKECLEEWRGVLLDECLVLFCTSGLSSAGADKIVEWFSKRPGTFVTDFVWWEDRPRVGVMRFDSRKKVDEVLSGIDGLSVITISNEEKVKVRRATDLDDLEWNAILPMERAKNSPQPFTSAETTDHTLETSTLGIKVEQDATSSSRASDEAPSINESSVTITEETPSEPDSTTTEVEVSHGHKNDNENTKKRKPVPVADSLNSNDKIEAPEPGPSPKKSKIDGQTPTTVSKPDVSPAPANSISVLMELAQRQKWPRPVFHFTSIEMSKAPTTFLCSVFVNDTEYKPDETISPALTKQQAKRDIANLCYKILTPTLPSKSNITLTSLHMEFTCIRNLVTIPEEEYNKVLKTACDLKVIFSQSDCSTDVALFRNGHLKLRLSDFGNTEPLIYVCHLKAPRNHPQSFSWIPEATVKQVLGGKQGIKRFAILESLEDSSRFDPNVKQFGWKLQHLSTEITFQLVLFKRFMAEVQVCRMAKYLCSFDPRCLPLITLVYYWATVNNLNLVIGGGDPNHKKHCHRVLPGQLTLEWLVIHFLCHKKVIPTPRQVQQRPHPILKERLSDIDVGFRATDTSFQQTWKSEATEAEVPSDTSSDEFYLTVL